MAGCRLPVLLLLLACVLWGVWLNCIVTAHQGSCRHNRYVKFFQPENDHYLEGHVFANSSVEKHEKCEERCLQAKECVSINTGAQINDKMACELSDSDFLQHPEDLKPRHGWTYRGTENPCATKPCLNNGKCLMGYTDKKYLCVCHASYTGENCEQATITICEEEQREIHCKDGGKILVKFANFGRLDDHTCPHDIYDYQSQTNCRAQTSLDRVLAKCQDKASCNLTPTTAFFSEDPCPGILKYLLVKYQCKKD